MKCMTLSFSFVSSLIFFSSTKKKTERFVLQFLMKYLTTFDEASTSELAKIKPAAVRGCIGAVKAPIVSFTEQVRNSTCASYCSRTDTATLV